MSQGSILNFSLPCVLSYHNLPQSSTHAVSESLPEGEEIWKQPFGFLCLHVARSIHKQTSGHELEERLIKKAIRVERQKQFNQG